MKIFCLLHIHSLSISSLQTKLVNCSTDSENFVRTKLHFRDEEEKHSLTGSKPESETDSMAEYGDTDPGRFTEDGSFIGTVSRSIFRVSDARYPAFKVVAVRGRCRSMHWGVLRVEKQPEARSTERRRRSEPLLPATSPFLPRIRRVGALGAATPPLLARSTASTPTMRRVCSGRGTSEGGTLLLVSDPARPVPDGEAPEEATEGNEEEEPMGRNASDGSESSFATAEQWGTRSSSAQYNSPDLSCNSEAEPLLPPIETDF